MELRHLRYFLAVGEALNFTRAAAQLRVAQPALSRQVQDLEDEIGVDYESVNRPRVGHERQGCSRTIDVVLHRGRPAQPDRPDHFSVHLNGKPSTPRCHTRKRGDAGQK